MNTLADLPGRPAPRPTGRHDGRRRRRRTLLAHGANPNARLSKPILQRQHSAGDGALGEGATPFLRAAKSGDVAMMRLLREHGADPSADHQEPDHGRDVRGWAGAGGGLGGAFPVVGRRQDRGDSVRCSSSGVDINAVDGNGQTALHVAAGQASERIVAALIERGARLDSRTSRDGRRWTSHGHRRPGGAGSAGGCRRAAAVAQARRVGDQRSW